MSMSIKQKLLKALAETKPNVEKVVCPLGEFYVRSMSGDAFSEWQRKGREDKNFPSRGQAIANCLCDENGERIGFSDAEVLDFDRADTYFTEPLLDAISRVSGLSSEAGKETEKK